MAKKDNKIFWIIGAIAAIILYNINPNLFTIITPKTLSYNSEMDKYVNKYYLPVAKDSQDFPLYPGTNFEFTSTPSSSSTKCIFINNKYYKISSYKSNLIGNCSTFGKPISFDGDYLFVRAKLYFYNDKYYLCSENKLKYTYSEFSLSNYPCKVKYTFEKNPQVNYHCDGKAIYSLSFDGKKTLTQKCSTSGCYSVFVSLDFKTRSLGGSLSDYTMVTRCYGDYVANKKFCSSDGKFLFKTDKEGDLTYEACCGCTGTTCKKSTSSCSETSKCKLVKGTGTGNINIFLYNTIFYPDYSDWLLQQLNNQTPYNEFTYNIYLESEKGACSNYIKTKQNDFRMSFDYAEGALGWGDPSETSRYGIGDLIFEKYMPDKKWKFLLFHELGHIYTHAGHTCDGSIMDKNGGNQKYTQQQINLIRKNLNSTYPIWDSSYKTCGKNNGLIK